MKKLRQKIDPDDLKELDSILKSINKKSSDKKEYDYLNKLEEFLIKFSKKYFGIHNTKIKFDDLNKMIDFVIKLIAIYQMINN